MKAKIRNEMEATVKRVTKQKKLIAEDSVNRQILRKATENQKSM
jgi:hypothetical protein